MTVRLIVRAGDYRSVLAKPSARMARLRPALEKAVAIRRASIDEEFRGEYGNAPGGGRIPWPRTRAFGNVPAPANTLRRTGSLHRAYMGSGRGAVERYTDQSAVFGVDGAVFPQAEILRRGGRIRVTARMRRFLAAVKGVHLKRSTRYIRIPARPHGGATPATREAIKRAFRTYISTGRA